MKVTVYHFRVYDGINDVHIVPIRKSTAPRIARVNGEIIPGTAEDVDITSLDDHDRYDPQRPQRDGPPVWSARPGLISLPVVSPCHAGRA